MDVKDYYSYEAEYADGVVITKRLGDLKDVKRISFIPNRKGLPQHNIVGVPMVRRFARSFQKVRFNDMDKIPDGLKWENGSNIIGTFSDLREIIKPLYSIRQSGPIDMCPWCLVLKVDEDKIIIAKPYEGRTSKKCNSRYKIPKLPGEYFHCVVGNGWRFYLKSSDGTVLMTPEDYELYI